MSPIVFVHTLSSCAAIPPSLTAQLPPAILPAHSQWSFHVTATPRWPFYGRGGGLGSSGYRGRRDALPPPAWNMSWPEGRSEQTPEHGVEDGAQGEILERATKDRTKQPFSVERRHPRVFKRVPISQTSCLHKGTVLVDPTGEEERLWGGNNMLTVVMDAASLGNGGCGHLLRRVQRLVGGHHPPLVDVHVSLGFRQLTVVQLNSGHDLVDLAYCKRLTAVLVKSPHVGDSLVKLWHRGAVNVNPPEVLGCDVASPNAVVASGLAIALAKLNVQGEQRDAKTSPLSENVQVELVMSTSAMAKLQSRCAALAVDRGRDLLCKRSQLKEKSNPFLGGSSEA